MQGRALPARILLRCNSRQVQVRLQNNAFNSADASTAMSGRTRFVNAEGTVLGANNTEDAHHAAPAGASGMTEDMFPLALNMETLNRTLSPDATKNTIPVTAGPSIIEDRKDELSYYYTWTIPTLDA